MRLRTLAELVAEAFPHLDAETAIAKGSILVDGFPVKNVNALVRSDATLRAYRPRPLRGEAKLAAALDAFRISVHDRIALDLGAAAGGFTRALLIRGARRVYAVDVGFGQLLGSLQQDVRVVNLERTNLSELDSSLISEPIEVVTADLSYVPLAVALPQLCVEVAPTADLVALVKPQFELGVAALPTEPDELRAAGRAAEAGARAAGWLPQRLIESPVTGAAGGAIELFLHARRGR
jgi:23S rRNA (cytidine1920-2'-O)/16S rRNA (cytidine1409-2'-O)-methyltransferase